MNKFGSRQFLMVISLSILFGSSSLINLGNAEFPIDPMILRLRYFIVGIDLIFFLAMARFDMRGLSTKPVPLFLFWSLFTLVSVISGIANNDSTSVRDSLWLMLAVPLIFFTIVPRLMDKNANFIISLSLFLGLSPYIFMSLLLNPLSQSNSNIYSGVFPNSNQLGFTCAAMASGVLILLIGSLYKTQNIWYLPFLLLWLFSLMIILVSNARTSLIAFVAMSLILLLKLLQKPQLLIGIIMSLITVIGLAIISSSGEQTQGILQQITNIQNKEALSGREEIWSKTINDMSLLGYGTNYFELNFGLGGHNSIIIALGSNGLIAAYFMIGFMVASFYYTYEYFRKYDKQEPYACGPLVITTGFWFLGMGEGMFGSLGNAMTIAYMLSIGVIIVKANPSTNQRFNKKSHQDQFP
ncbi:MAG: hypothetical protein HC786_01575 [Richelia sp. CSU_2_1]|nr:hypothetical protein [Richelia sp. CSU_2_1]